MYLASIASRVLRRCEQPSVSRRYDPEYRAIDCPECGLAQRAAVGGPCDIVYCRRCRSPLAHRFGKSLDAALACAAATVLLFIAASCEPFLTTSVLGASRTSVLPSSVIMLWREGWPVLAMVVGLFLLVFPGIRFGALTAVLATARLGARPRWLAPAFRLATALETWAMLDVFLLALAVAYARLHATIEVTMEIGAFCFVAAAVLSLLTRATLDHEQVLRLIGPGVDPPPDAPAGRPSPSNSIALLVAAALLYLPANLYPIATIPIGFQPTAYTVLGGIKDLAESHFLGLAILVFCASIAVPLLKMVGLSWCVSSVVLRSSRHLVAKTRVYRWLEEVGRWSMVDPFTIACFVPVLHYNSLIDSRAEAAAVPFAAVVILTTQAVKSFDPRWMWESAEPRP